MHVRRLEGEAAEKAQFSLSAGLAQGIGVWPPTRFRIRFWSAPQAFQGSQHQGSDPRRPAEGTRRGATEGWEALLLDRAGHRVPSVPAPRGRGRSRKLGELRRSRWRRASTSRFSVSSPRSTSTASRRGPPTVATGDRSGLTFPLPPWHALRDSRTGCRV